MKKLCGLLIGTLLIVNGLQGQFRVSGKVTDGESQEPLPGAAVFVPNLSVGVATDDNGHFELVNMPPGNFSVVVSFLGYQTLETKALIQSNQVLDFVLTPSPILTDEVIVSSTRAQERAPVTFNTIQKAEIEDINMGQDLPFLLNQMPSVVTTSDAGAGIGYTGLRIRGSDATRINVTINGIPLNDAESMGVFWVNLPDLASSVESIQVQRGVGTSTNGPGAFGATINVQTTGLNPHPYAKIENAIGSFNSRKHTLSFGSGLLKGHFTVDGRLSKIYSEGYIDRAYSDLNSFLVSAAFYGKTTMIKGNIISGRERTYQAWWGVPQARLENDLEGLQSYIANNGLDTEEANNLMSSGRTYNFYTYDNEIDNYQQDHYQLLIAQDLIPGSLGFNTSLYFTHGEGYFEQFRKNDTFSSYGLPDAIVGQETVNVTDLIRRRWLRNDLVGTNFSFDYRPSRSLNLIFGGAYSEYDGDHFGEIIWARVAGETTIRERIYDNTGLKSDFSIYGKVNYSISDRWFLFADVQFRSGDYKVEGVDLDQRTLDVVQSFDFLNPKVGLTYTLKDGEDVYLSFAVANKEPLRDDLIDAPAGIIPRHETLNNWEMGYRLGSENLRFRANTYLMAYKNQLVLTGEVNDVGANVRKNVKDSYRAGVEIQSDVKINAAFNIMANITLSENRIALFEEVLYDYGPNWDEYKEVRMEYRDTDISFSPSIISALSLYYHPAADLEITWNTKFVGEQFLDNTSNEDRTISAFLVNDLLVSYALNPPKFGKIEMSVLVNNILNRLYESNGYTYGYRGGGNEIRENLYYPQAGRNFMASLKVSL